MPNYQLKNDEIRTWTGGLGSKDAAGDVVQNPGATFSVESITPPNVLNVVVNGTDVTANAIGRNTVGIAVTFAESGGTPEASFVWMVDTVDDLTPAAVSFDPTAPSTATPQPVPPQT